MDKSFEKLTIFLTLKGRDSFTYRWMSYMDSIKCPFKIIIADGGESLELENHLSDNKNYPNLNYKYIKFPYDSTLDRYLNKIKKGLELIDTDYFVFADNDDFFLIENFPLFINFLEQRPDYIGARGNLVNLEVFSETGISKSIIRGNRYVATSIESNSIEHDKSSERISYICGNFHNYDYYTNWYSILRKREVLDFWSRLISIPTIEMIFLEVLFHILMVNSGKIKVFKIPYYIRQQNTSMHGDSLVIGNEFLERSLATNSFSCINLYVESVFAHQDSEFRLNIYRSIAYWLSWFIFNLHKRNFQKFTYSSKLKKYIKFHFVSFRRNFWVYFFVRTLLVFLPRKEILRIKKIEDFILY